VGESICSLLGPKSNERISLRAEYNRILELRAFFASVAVVSHDKATVDPY